MTQPTAAEAKVIDKLGNPQIANRQPAQTVDAIVTTETAVSGWDTNEINMVNNLKTDVTNLHARLSELIDKLEAHGLLAEN